MKNQLTRLLPFVVLLVFTLIFLHKLVSLDFISFGHLEDHLRLLYPYHTYDAQALKSGKLPLWNPYSLSGFPYLASMRSHIFYPLDVLYLFLPAHLGMNFSAILHVFLAGSCMFLLARVLGLDRFASVVSALAFMFSGYIVNELWWGHEERLSGLMWTPAMFALFLKAANGFKPLTAALAGVTLAMAIFSGHVQAPYYSLFALFLLMLFLLAGHLTKSDWRAASAVFVCFLIVLTVGAGLAAIQVLPAAELSKHSIRSPSQDSFAFMTRWSMGYSYVLTFLFPRFSAIGQRSFPFPAALGYIGVLPLILALASFLGRRNRSALFWQLLLAASIVLALGRFTPAYQIFYRYFPGFSAFRNPIFFVYLYTFAAAVLAGFGAQTLRRMFVNHPAPGGIQINRVQFKVVMALGVVCLGVAAGTFWGLFKIPAGLGKLGATLEASRATLVYDFAVAGLVVCLTGALVLFRERYRMGDVILTCGIVGMIFVDLAAVGSRLIETYDFRPFVAKPGYLEAFRKEREPFRVLPILDYPEQDAILKLNGIASINGYGSLEILQDYVDFAAAFQREPVIQEATVMRVANAESRAVDLLNAKYVLSSRELSGIDLQPVFRGSIPAAKTWDPYRTDTLPLIVYENRRAFPRAFIVHAAVAFPDRRQILPAMNDSKYDLRNVAFFEEMPAEGIQNAGAGKDAVSFLGYAEDEVALATATESSGYLVLGDNYYPGWKAYVDGRETKIYRADYLFRAVYLPAGRHTVRFVYSPASVKTGAAFSVATLVALVGLAARQIFRRKTRMPPSD